MPAGRRAAMGHAARARVQAEFSETRVIQAYLDALAEVAPQPQAPPGS